MKITWRIFYLVFLACCFSGCKDSAEAVSQESLHSDVQVAVVFYPGQLGDHGYADDIMESVPQMGKLAGGDQSSRIDAQFFAFDSKQETQRSMSYWGNHPENPFLGGMYQHRLLVLTDARQVAWLDGIPTEHAQDELLLLNTAKEVVDSLAQTWGNRVHALNISVAHEVEDLCRYMRHRMAAEGGQNGSLDIYRMAESYHTADSIDIVCQSVAAEDISVAAHYMGEWHTDSITGEINYVASQQYVRFLAEFHYQYNKDHFLLLDGGSYNLVFDDQSPKDEAGMGRTVLLDLNTGTDNYCIRRGYDRALLSWIAQWVKMATPDAMPRIMWHGSWDGYVKSTIPTVP